MKYRILNSKTVSEDIVLFTIIGKICEELGTYIGDFICIEKKQFGGK